jgi:hypothetical protein
MSQTNALNGIHNSRSIDWDKLITGQFAEDKWHLPSMVEKYLLAVK